MPQNISVAVSDLKLDLKNYRTVPQKTEADAIEALAEINPNYFWGLMDSLLDDGYLLTENIIVLKGGQDYVVKEGNRRIAALKMILGQVVPSIKIPDAQKDKISKLGHEWKEENKEVPCAVFGARDSALVDKIVTLTHGKGQSAGRSAWTAVARARHNRDVNKASEPALDLLEKYLIHGRNVTNQQVDRWSGDYPYTVLVEAIQKIAPRFDVSGPADLASNYPAIPNVSVLDDIVYEIGQKNITFPKIRQSRVDFAARYGLPSMASAAGVAVTVPSTEGVPSAGTVTADGIPSTEGVPTTPGAPVTPGTIGSATALGTAPVTGSVPAATLSATAAKKVAATSLRDPRSVARVIRGMKIMGTNRSKLVDLRKEMLLLIASIDLNPFAFCFILRSVFEISAKAYCDDHKGTGGPSIHYAKSGQEKKLKELLDEVTQHIISSQPDKQSKLAMDKHLHGAITELGKPDGLLSIDSQNALIHNPNFSILPGDICAVFGNVFPLLEEMNK